MQTLRYKHFISGLRNYRSELSCGQGERHLDSKKGAAAATQDEVVVSAVAAGGLHGEILVAHFIERRTNQPATAREKLMPYPRGLSVQSFEELFDHFGVFRGVLPRDVIVNTFAVRKGFFAEFHQSGIQFRIRMRIQQTLPSWRLDPQSLDVRLRWQRIRVVMLWLQIPFVSCEYFLSSAFWPCARCRIAIGAHFLQTYLNSSFGPVVSRNCLPIWMIEVCNSAHCRSSNVRGAFVSFAGSLSYAHA